MGGSGGRRDYAKAGMPSDLWGFKFPFRSDGGQDKHGAATVGDFSPQATLPVDPASSF